MDGALNVAANRQFLRDKFAMTICPLTSACDPKPGYEASVFLGAPTPNQAGTNQGDSLPQARARFCGPDALWAS
jgi:hypothetical protein